MTGQAISKRISYLGPEASFTHLAATKVFPDSTLVPFTTIPECIEAVVEGSVDYAVVPLENALEGSVPLTVDYLFHEAQLYVTAEVLSPIEQHLLVHPENRHAESFEAIYSHPHALAQCHKYLYYTYKSTPLEQYSSTAAAAKMVSELPERNIAAIGNEFSAQKYGLDILQRDIHDFHFNHTRFFVLSKTNHKLENPQHEDQIKTTLMMTLPEDDRSGVLHQILSVFAWRRLNLSKIESRPLKTGLGDYFFIADVLADENDAMMRGAFEELTALGCTVKTLGSYYTYKN
ncbi:Prephenate dehydratase [Planococcus halocryophilus Or1]|uniref:Prephenate dehydratase n=1 Tax=Planococcus halocryophilus TaxID=1215089 RepID=A0A1C7DN80_9BACL|nr:prephenate dehydratase [Planococcus halocryophilus]ANU12828.1 prephenate dehydratase [Planococcus halocryophilus]EMF45316.1 Prephenate dehydratase [Planococcus halocryophilus Or1]